MRAEAAEMDGSGEAADRADLHATGRGGLDLPPFSVLGVMRVSVGFEVFP